MAIFNSAEFHKFFKKDNHPASRPVYNVHNPNGLKLLVRLRLRLNHLNEHKFNQNFKGCINPLCSCNLVY